MAVRKIGANKPTGTLLAYEGGSRINTDRFLKRAVKVQGSLGSGMCLARKSFGFWFLSHKDWILARFELGKSDRFS